MALSPCDTSGCSPELQVKRRSDSRPHLSCHGNENGRHRRDSWKYNFSDPCTWNPLRLEMKAEKKKITVNQSVVNKFIIHMILELRFHSNKCVKMQYWYFTFRWTCGHTQILIISLWAVLFPVTQLSLWEADWRVSAQHRGLIADWSIGHYGKLEWWNLIKKDVRVKIFHIVFLYVLYILPQTAKSH